MNNKFLKIRDNRGTALITAFLMMGVLIAVSLVLSMLVIREVKITKDFLSAGKAYYAAESGVEEALYHLENNLPGWEPAIGNSEKNIGGSEFKYSLDNRCDAYPCPDEFDLESIPTIIGTGSVDYSVFYDVLNLDENVTIPMFISDENGVKSIKNFVVQYYADFNPETDLRLGPNVTAGSAAWDVLRWKVFGMKIEGSNYKTESINDFSAVSPLTTGTLSDSTNPSWFGTGADACSKVVEGIKCLEYASDVEWNVSEDESACVNTEARDYYEYAGDEVISVVPCYSISTFMTNHIIGTTGATGMNYLSLTNMMNPAMFKDPDVSGETMTMEKRIEMSKIHFRVEAYKDDAANGEENVTDEFVREYANITSDGYSGDAKQSINVKIKRDSYMPVFNFAIYSTYGAKVGTTDDSYYTPGLYESVDYFK